MVDGNEPLRIEELDRTHDGVIVTFFNGVNVLYGAEFLYGARNKGENIIIPDLDANDEWAAG